MSRATAASPAADYPEREAFFAHRVVRQLFKTCAAMEIGETAALLVVFVAHTEDAKRYSGPPNFYNGQLIPILGIRKWETLDKARRAAVEAGWVHYIPGGTHKPGIYWSMIPERFLDIDDAPLGETIYPPNGHNSDRVYPPNGHNRGDNHGDNSGYNRGDNLGEHPTLDPNPIPGPIPGKKPATAGAPPSRLLELIDGWNALPAGVVKHGNGAKRDQIAKAVLAGWRRSQNEPEQREAFTDIPALLEAIQRATFCHGQPWFTPAWLFGKNRNGEFNALKLLNGDYEASGNGRPNSVGPGQRHQADAGRGRGVF